MMDETLFALIESERQADERYAEMSDHDLAAVAVLLDVDGSKLKIYADGSYVALPFDARCEG